MKKIYRVAFFVFSVFSGLNLSAQREGALWYFGANAGISFVQNDSLNNRKITGKPFAINNGMLNTEEGCTSISDSDGNLLFYSDGITVWNKNHEVMKNGNGLYGHPSSTSSAMAIPYQNNQYYLFTLDHVGEKKGLCYSIIDMNAENDLGEIVEKNISIKAPLTEKLSAVRHRNNKSVWIIAHGIENAEFYAYLLDESGFSKQPVVSTAGTEHKKTDFGTMNYQGYMKISPDGSKLALAIEESNIFEVFDFNNETGVISNPITIQLHDFSFTYGVEFSPDGSLLYGSAAGTGELYQFNLKAGSTEAIINSKTLIGKTTNENWIGALQLGPDKKIYFTIYNTNKLGVIEFPEKSGALCGFKLDAVELSSDAKLGLPTFFQSFFSLKEQPKVVEINKAVVLQNIYFEYDKADLKPISFKELDKLADNLKDNPTYSILITGHTDNKGSAAHNLELSKNRAAAVGEYLSKKGVEKERIFTKGMGSSAPLASNKTEAGQSKNRRVEFTITTEKDKVTDNVVMATAEVKKSDLNQNKILQLVKFEYDRADIKVGTFKELDNIVTQLNENPLLHIVITGHTDNVGPNDYNLELSRRRAESVGNYLSSKGIEKNRIRTKGYGSAVPLANNNTVAGQIKNRRVEYKFVPSNEDLPEKEIITEPVKEIAKVENPVQTEIPKKVEKPVEIKKDLIEKSYFDEKSETGKNYILKNVRFESDKDLFLDGSSTELDKLLKYLNEDKSLNVIISGHTDIKGYKVRNIQLSARRAAAICEYLVEKGIDRSRISFQGYGSEKPINSNDTEEGRDDNRRVEVRFFK
jgi:outer membrane protein OmpA-like peptidoglycan-associated protein